MFQNQSEILQDFDVSTACRVCLSSKGRCGLFWMNATSKQLLAQMFNILVDKESSWKICVPCLQAIERAADFKHMAAQSDRLIKGFFEKQNASAYEDDIQIEEIEETEEIDEEQFEELEVPLPEFVTVQSRNLNQKPSNQATVAASSKKPRIIFQMPMEPTASTSTPEPSTADTSPSDKYMPKEPPPFQCISCPKNFPTKKLLVHHRMIRHTVAKKQGKPRQVEGGGWVCCGEEYTDDTLEDHKLEKHPKSYACHPCHVKFASRAALSKHQKETHRNQTDIKKTYCIICQKDYPSLISYRSHVSKYHKEAMINVDIDSLSMD